MRTPLDFVLIITLAAITFAVYGINRYTDTEDSVNDSTKAEFFKEHSYLYPVSILTLVCSAGLLLLTKKFTVYHFVLIFLGVAYSIRMIPTYKKGGFVLNRIKDIPFAKSISVSLTWGTSYFAINWFIYPSAAFNGYHIVLLMLSFILACFVNTNFCDILDIAGDALEKVPTLPVMFGIKNTYRYIMPVPSLLLLALIAYSFCANLITFPFTLFLLLNLCYPLVYISLHNLKKYPRSVIVPITDMSCVIFPAGVFVLYFAGY